MATHACQGTQMLPSLRGFSLSGKAGIFLAVLADNILQPQVEYDVAIGRLLHIPWVITYLFVYYIKALCSPNHQYTGPELSSPILARPRHTSPEAHTLKMLLTDSHLISKAMMHQTALLLLVNPQRQTLQKMHAPKFTKGNHPLSSLSWTPYTSIPSYSGPILLHITYPPRPSARGYTG